MSASNTYGLTRERIIGADPAEVFDRYTDPEAAKTLFAGEPGWFVEASTDLRVGGTWDITMGPTRAEAFSESNVFTEIDRPHSLSFGSTLTLPDRTRLERDVEARFAEAEHGKTLVTIVQKGFPSAELRDLVAGGVVRLLDALERVTAQSRNA
jgi:uncharacterized protein YndB with AHSA1/START domain